MPRRLDLSARDMALFALLTAVRRPYGVALAFKDSFRRPPLSKSHPLFLHSLFRRMFSGPTTRLPLRNHLASTISPPVASVIIGANARTALAREPTSHDLQVVSN